MRRIALLLAAALAAARAADVAFASAADAVGPHSLLPEVDCAIRGLAAEFADLLLPWASPSLWRDALRLAVDCNVSTLTAAPRALRTPIVPHATVPTFYADPTRGSDAAAGTQAAPFLTIARALAAARGAGAPAAIVLRGGTFFLPATLELGPSDAGLSITAFPGEVPVLSAGASLGGLLWHRAAQPSPSPSPQPGPSMAGPFPGSLLAMASGGGCVDGPGKSNPGVCAPLGQFDDNVACTAACVANTNCTGWTWHDTSLGSWAKWCYARLDGSRTIVGGGHDGHTCGWRTAPPPPLPPLNVWVASVPAGVATFDQLFFRGRRLVRARWPNANPEVDLSPVGYAHPAGFAPARNYPPPNETHIPGVRAWDSWFPNFQWGTGGTVANFTTGSFWGTRSPPAGSQFSTPSGMTLPPEVPTFSASATNPPIAHVFQVSRDQGKIGVVRWLSANPFQNREATGVTGPSQYLPPPLLSSPSLRAGGRKRGVVEATPSTLRMPLSFLMLRVSGSLTTQRDCSLSHSMEQLPLATTRLSRRSCPRSCASRAPPLPLSWASHSRGSPLRTRPRTTCSPTQCASCGKCNDSQVT